MATKNYLNLSGLSTFLDNLKSLFATQSEVAELDETTDTYVLNVDYDTHLAFNTSEIVSDGEIIYANGEGRVSNEQIYY